ncbi:O-sialoglycoprotein endopeptidase [Peptacetobacter hiranonis]|uniref:O-sialoglycoprotein endopeptidase n=1 Tax=Peptacetobacter hiranonis TaxID=89152 RepID=UPI0022DF5FB1|nr:O-sialoglycoprotein endopeptidase [Peptacetobacter hiranonis]
MTENNRIIIGIDTSCYTTSIAAITLNREIVFNEKIMLNVKNGERGLRQSDAVFQHIKNFGEISERLKKHIHKKGYKVEMICASAKPRDVEESYMPVFEVGKNFAKTMAAIFDCEMLETTHQENHIAASLYGCGKEDLERFISVHMSGGTMEILLTEKCNKGYKTEIVGGTKDISFGQLIDRVGVKMGYDFPAGKYVDENALLCKEDVMSGLKTSVKDGYMNISGLENQVYKLMEEKDKYYVSKAVMNAAIKSLEKALRFVCDKYDIEDVVFVGGVASSKYISERLTKKLQRNNINSFFTDGAYSSDNACGCAIIGLDNFII